MTILECFRIVADEKPSDLQTTFASKSSQPSSQTGFPNM